MLADSVRAALKEQMVGELKHWQESIASFQIEAVEPGAYHYHPADDGTVQEMMAANGNSRELATKRIRDLTQALDMINEPDYGQCHQCHDKIPLKRLKSVPTARLCVTCKEQEEKGLPFPAQLD